MSDPKDFIRRTKRRLMGRPDSGWNMPVAPPAKSNYPVSKLQTYGRGGWQIETFDVDAGCLGGDERGAVWPILPSEAFPGEDGLNLQSYPVPREEIRSALLFFDKFDVPKQNVVSGAGWCESEFRRVGVLTQSESRGVGNMVPFVRELPFEVLARRDRLDPGRWTLARPATADGIPINRLRPSTAIAVTIHRGLPIFSGEVELEDVLDFKHRAWDELLALRQHLDDLAADIGRNGANGIEQNPAYLKFIDSLNDHVRRMNESNRQKVWHSFKASFDLPSLATPGIEAMISGQLNAAALAAGAIMIGIKTVSGLIKPNKGPNPFEYLTSANLEL